MISAIKSTGKNHSSWQGMCNRRMVGLSNDVRMKSLDRLDGHGICDIEMIQAEADDYSPRKLQTKPCQKND